MKTVKNVWLVFVVAGLFWAGCGGRTGLVAGEVSPSPSRTVTLTPDATEFYQAAMREMDTQIAASAATREARITPTSSTLQSTLNHTPQLAPSSKAPTPTITPTPTSFVTLEAPQASSENYILVQPAPATLIGLSLMKSLPEYEMAVWKQGNDDWIGDFSDALQFEWGRTFPQNINQVDQLSALIRNEEQTYGIYLNHQIQVDVLSEYYFQYFNENHIAFIDQKWVNEDKVSWVAYLIEADHDSSPEWLVQVVTRLDLHASFWLTLDQKPNGTYLRIPHTIYSKTGFFSVETDVYDIVDLTGDGLSDMILVDSSPGMIGREFTFFTVAIGTSDGFEIISDFQEHRDMMSLINTLSYELQTSNAISLPYFHITNVHELPWGCLYETSKDYEWIDGKEEVTYGGSSEPETIECYIARAVDPDNPPKNQDAIRWLNYSYTNGDLLPENQVYVLFRLALMHALEGETSAAQNYLNSLVELAINEAHPVAVALAEQIQPLLEKNPILPYRLCLAAEAIALPISDYSMFSFEAQSFPYEGMPDGYPTTLCDTRQIQDEVLEDLKIDSSLSPENALRSAGFPVLAVEQIPQLSPVNVWLVAFNDASPDYWFANNWDKDHKIFLLHYVENDGWRTIASFDSPDHLEWVNRDFTGDDIPEIAMAYQYNNPEYTTCELGEDQYSAYIISRLYEEWTVSYYENDVCLPMNIAFSFEDLLQDKNGDGMVDWVVDHLEEENYDVSMLQTILPNLPLAVHLASYNSDLEPRISKTKILRDLTTRFFASLNPSHLRPDLEFYRTRWGTDGNPTSEQIYAHLTYLLALTYELEANPRAVALFYDIWANHPETLWAYLAASRLELKTPP